MKITYSAELIQLRTLFERRTKANLKDCFYDANNMPVFVVSEGDMSRAVGKNGANARMMEALLKRKIKIVEFAPTPEAFLANLLMPMRAERIEQDGETMTIMPPDPKTRGMIIGRSGSNLRNFEHIMKQYYAIKEIKVK